MSMYQPGIPTGTVQLDEDYLNIQHNFTQLDTSFGIDHYKFSDQTANNGFHNTVTTPLIVGSAHPITAANVPKFYSMKDGTNGQTIQYSRLGGNAVPSPVTYIQSQLVPINIPALSSINIYDFTGINSAIANLYVMCTGSFNDNNNFNNLVFWNGAAFLFNPAPGVGFFIGNAGNILTLNTGVANPRNGVSWTLQILRIT